MSATPTEGQVYASPDGTPMLYVREEAGEHMFVLAAGRVVYTRTYPAEALPPELQLLHDPDARPERDALAAAMKLATELHPESARALRNRYREALGAA